MGRGALPRAPHHEGCFDLESPADRTFLAEDVTNYRHAYHAGNHADVLKHIVLARIVEHLKRKPKPFRVLDLHAGIGLYALQGEEASKTREWEQGVGRLYDGSGAAIPLGPEAEALIAPWRQVIASSNGQGPLTFYPGSPEIIRQLIRADDRLMLNELHPEDFSELSERYARDKRVTLTRLDAGIAAKAQLPPPERRGLILIDPPYEKPDEVRHVGRMLQNGLKRFATGVYVLWYPMTGDGLASAFTEELGGLALPEALEVELLVRAPVRDGGLAGSGLVIINPPWQLDTEIAALMPQLRDRLAQTGDARSSIGWLNR